MVDRRTFAGSLAAAAAWLGFRTAQAAAPTPASFSFDPVSPSNPVRRVLWSWTTKEQAAELRAGAPLFTRSESPGLGRGTLFHWLDEQQGVEAKLLREERFTKGRYAWVNPWAIASGFAGEDYGTELLRIELEPEARFGYVTVGD